MTKIGKTFNAHLIHNLFLSPYKRLKQLTACSRVRHNINVELNIYKSKPLHRKKQVGYKNLTSKPLLDLYGDNPFGISHLLKEAYYCPALQGGATKKKLVPKHKPVSVQVYYLRSKPLTVLLNGSCFPETLRCW